MSSSARWHQALAFAVTGQLVTGLGQQTRPEVEQLARELEARRAAGDLRLVDPPVSVPDDLMIGLGAAQYWAALAALRQALAGPEVRPLTDSRPLTRDERRLEADRPPHH